MEINLKYLIYFVEFFLVVLFLYIFFRSSKSKGVSDKSGRKRWTLTPTESKLVSSNFLNNAVKRGEYKSPNDGGLKSKKTSGVGDSQIKESSGSSLSARAKANKGGFNWSEVKSYVDNGSSMAVLDDDNTLEGDDIGSKNLILLVDDAMVILKKVGGILEKCGYKVVRKKDGVEALDWIKRKNIVVDIIITDMEMPRMSGKELIQEVRGQRGYTDVPIIVISAHAKMHVELMEKQMIQGFLMKPFKDNELIDQVNYFINSN